MTNHFSEDVLEAAKAEPEVALITEGRVTGKPRRVVTWVTEHEGRIFIRSGGGLRRDWPRNLLKAGQGVLRIGGREVPVRARHLEDLSEAREVSGYVRAKYGPGYRASREGEAPTPAELATFELLPA